MKHRMRRLTPTLVAVVVAMVAAVVAVAVPASPAAAGLPSGSGWSASWNYYASNAFEVHLTIPGGKVDGYALDSGGQRHFNATVQDTDGRDRACVRMRLIATDMGSLGSKTACNGGSEVISNTRQFAEALFVHIDLMVDGSIAKSFFTFVPSSADDPNLRIPGTGTEWRYTSASTFHLEVHRQGVQVIGDGGHSPIGGRVAGAGVAHENVNGGCVLGWLADATVVAGDGTCQPGQTLAFADDFTGYIKMTGCYLPAGGTWRCLTMHVPEPH